MEVMEAEEGGTEDPSKRLSSSPLPPSTWRLRRSVRAADSDQSPFICSRCGCRNKGRGGCDGASLSSRIRSGPSIDAFAC